MLPDRVSNSGPLTYKSGALPIALHGLGHLAMASLLVHWQSDQLTLMQE